MTSSNKPTKLRVRTNTRAGGIRFNHGTAIRKTKKSDKLRVRTGTRAGGTFLQHGVRVRRPKQAQG